MQVISEANERNLEVSINKLTKTDKTDAEVYPLLSFILLLEKLFLTISI